MDLDTTNMRDVWLVKVPKYMAEAWKKAPQDSRLGKLQIPKIRTGFSKLKFTTDPSLQPKKDDKKDLDRKPIPEEHILTLQPMTHQRMVIISQSKQDSNAPDKVAVEGNVKELGVLRPPADLSYMNLKSDSIRQAAKPNRTTKILEKDVISYKPRGAAQLAHEADLRKKKEEAKKTIREDKEVVQGRLFLAFQRQQYYNIKDLTKITGQSVPYLKEILKEICNYCSSGAHKNMWELKAEYRHYKSASTSKD